MKSSLIILWNSLIKASSDSIAARTRSSEVIINVDIYGRLLIRLGKLELKFACKALNFQDLQDPDRYAFFLKIFLGLTYRVLAKMKNTRSKRSISFSFRECIVHVLDLPAPPDAIMGMSSVSESILVIGRSYPSFVPSFYKACW